MPAMCGRARFAVPVAFGRGGRRLPHRPLHQDPPAENLIIPTGERKGENPSLAGT
ncbi:hypothetical protein Misp01_27290 [Microtetraspora sp. NBRC 13810]|nr:hypothetical protein Misp01_27290 [Microtetraspora sp. NBRC 13810]